MTLQLTCPAQNYAWGRLAEKSEVGSGCGWCHAPDPGLRRTFGDAASLIGRGARLPQVAKLAKANGVNVDDSKPYAELW
jgi:hypothetical protein